MNKQLRRTKIIATLGPASNQANTIQAMITAGVDLVRINFSHGEHQAQTQLINTARQAAKLANKEIGIIADLQGPKIRIGQFEQAMVDLKASQSFTLDCNTSHQLGNHQQVSVDYPQLYQDITAGDTLLLDDGLVSLTVNQVTGKQIHCTVTNDCRLSDNKGINKLGGGLSARTLTEKDRQDLKQAIASDVDYIAISFTKDALDIKNARQEIKRLQGHAGVIAKIERAEALTHLDEIIEAADAVMVARGDLGVEIGLAEVPFEQKRIIDKARALDKAVITATQMMESMINQPMATRAEVSDVANAVLDGTDAVMFSAETAIGKYPINVIETTHHVCLSAEKSPNSQRSIQRQDKPFKLTDEAIAMAVMYVANRYPIRAIIALTESGATPLWMSRIRSNIPIYALTRHIQTIRKTTLFRGVYPVDFDVTKVPFEKLHSSAIDALKQLNRVTDNDKVLLTHGTEIGAIGGTDSMKIIDV